MLFTQRDYAREIDELKQELKTIKNTIQMNKSNKIDLDINSSTTNENLGFLNINNTDKILSCIGSTAKMSIITSVIDKSMTVAELVEKCNLNSTGQAYHHMKPLLVSGLLFEEEKGKYIVNPDKLQGIKLLLQAINTLSN